MRLRSIAAYTLLELSLVLLVLGMVAGAFFTYSANTTTAANNAALTATLNTIETAMQNYRNLYLRIPCPAGITLAENNASFGVEVGTAGDGNCTGYSYINSGTDPDNSDPLYDATAASKVVAGGVPTKTLRIDDKYAYDPWGRKILFVVDKRLTATNAFTSYAMSSSSAGAIVIKKTSADSLANAVTYKGIYALVSFGPNGHGGYVRNPKNTSSIFSAGSTNTDEQKNCHCDSSAVATAFDRIFVQKPRTETTTLTNVFDDVVRFKTRWQMASYAEMQ